MTFSRTEPFCDWLDCTCSPEQTFVPELERFLVSHCFPVINSDPQKTVYRVGDGVLHITTRKGFHRAGASGSAIRALEALSSFRDYVNVLGSVPHRVTRLDVAVDVFRDAPEVLRALELRYPDDRFSFGRKSLKVTRLYSARETDGQQTGTWYVGHRSSARVTARVYDKQHEALEKRCEVLPPTTRYELTFRKDYNCSLFDVLMPKTLFYSHASPDLLDSDGPVEHWESRGTVPWVSEPRDTDLTVERFDRAFWNSPDLRHLIKMGSRFGDTGKSVMLRRFKQGLEAVLKASAENGELSDEELTVVLSEAFKTDSEAA